LISQAVIKNKLPRVFRIGTPMHVAPEVAHFEKGKARMAVQTKNTSPETKRIRNRKARVYTKNNRSHIVSAVQLDALVSEIGTNPQQTTRFYARKTGLNVADVNVAVEKNPTIRKLARNGQIAIMDRGRSPDWFRQMAIAQQSLVPVLDADEQYRVIASASFPVDVSVDDQIVREDAELATTLFGAVLARTNMSASAARALANEMLEIIQHQAEGFSNAKSDIRSLAKNIQSVNLRLTTGSALRIAAE
jgi:hypothetical protein